MKHCFILFLFLSAYANAQYEENSFSIGLNFVYTTDARIFLNPNSPDPVERNSSFGLSDIINPGINFRYKLLDEILLGLNIEYMKSTATGMNEKVISNGFLRYINVEDGFEMIPVELSIYYMLPFSTEKLKFLMGGGLGYYYASMIRKFGDVQVSNAKRDFAYGVQVAIDMDYLLTDNIALKGEMKFRDPQISVKSMYNKLQYNYNGSIVKLTRQEFDSQIDVNGITFVLGTIFYF
jgi:hypothetical protein